MSTNLKQDVSIGENLKKFRKNANLSQEAVAAKLELMGHSISREIISQMELGRYSIKISVLIALKEIYKVDTFDEFFEGLY